MKIFGVLFLFLAVTVLAESLSEGHVELESFAANGQFVVAVKVHDVASATQAVVTYQYWQNHPEFGRLLRTRSEVIMVASDTFVMGEGILALPEDVRNVDVTLVKDLEKHRFEFGKDKR